MRPLLPALAALTGPLLEPTAPPAAAPARAQLYGPGFSGLFLYGLALPINDNDFFGLLQTIQREMHTVDALATLNLPSATISKLVSLPPPTASLRLDASHSAIVWLNDVEKDRKYAQFGKELREMTRMNMFGQMSFCRRNVLNMVFVVDPTNELGEALISYMLSVFQQGAPVRFGLVLVPGISTASLGTRKASAYVPGTSRLRDLASVYDSDAWKVDAVASAAEKAAKAPAEEAAAAAVSGGGGSGEDESDAVRLGTLMTKIFIFLKKKAGTSSAARFLGGVQDARQSATMSFFGGGALDELADHHLLSALQSAMPSSLRKTYDAGELIEKLTKNAIPGYEQVAAAGTAFLDEKGLGEVPCMLMNGVLTPLTANYEREVMTALSQEHRLVTQMIHRKTLSVSAAERIPTPGGTPQRATPPTPKKEWGTPPLASHILAALMQLRGG